MFNRRLLWAMIIGWVAAAPNAFAQIARAQEGRTIPRTFLNKNTVHLPIQIDDRARPHLQEIQLYVKDGPQSPWTLKEKVPATQTHFTYRAPRDGEYWFNVVTVDRGGRAIPADVNSEPPAIIVMIDTTPPQVELHNLGQAPEGHQIQCEVRDAHPDATKARFFFQTRDQIWRPLEGNLAQPNMYLIPNQAALTGMVRVVTADLAGNAVTREFNLATIPVTGGPIAGHATPPAAPLTGAPVTGAPAPKNATNVIVENPLDKGPELPYFLIERTNFNPSAPPPVSRPSQTTGSSLADRVEIVSNKTNPAPAVDPISRIPTTAQGPELRTTDQKPAGHAPQASDLPARLHLVNNANVVLDYQIEQTGASGVGKIEIWFTRDMGQSWQRLGEDADCKSPAEVNLPGEGLFGVSLVVANGRGFGATPPNPGDTPDWWIEVDTTKPKADILNVRSSPNGNDGSLHVTWTARDKNLHAEPIDLFFATSREGPWVPFAKSLKNDGLFCWTPSPEIGSHAYIRLQVRDAAGNSTSCETLQSVPLDDLSRPRGRVLGVSSGSVRPNTPMPSLPMTNTPTAPNLPVSSVPMPPTEPSLPPVSGPPLPPPTGN